MLIRKQLLVQILHAWKDFHLNMPKLTLLKYQWLINFQNFFLEMVSTVTFNIVFTERRSIPKTWRIFMMAHFTSNCPERGNSYRALTIFHFSWILMVFPYSSPLKFPYGHCILLSMSSIIANAWHMRTWFLRVSGLEKKSQLCGLSLNHTHTLLQHSKRVFTLTH